jgi:hypothetical protein
MECGAEAGSADFLKTLSARLLEKKREGRKSIAEADRRRWELPKTQWQDWEVPLRRTRTGPHRCERR